MSVFGAGEHGASGAERFELEHRSARPLDSAVVLFDDVVDVALNLYVSLVHASTAAGRPPVCGLSSR